MLLRTGMPAMKKIHELVEVIIVPSARVEDKFGVNGARVLKCGKERYPYCTSEK
jgi:hypothetical protein